MPTPINLPLPIKGINRYGPRSSQPDGTTPTASNVLPFDRYGRMRIAQRPGTGKLWAAAIGSGANVQLLQQTVAAADPTLADDGSTVLNETFTYSNGNLGTVSGGVWTNYNGSMVLTPGSLVVASNVVNTATGDGNALYTTTPTLPSSYIVRADFLVNELGNTLYMGLITKSDASSGNRFTFLINLRSTAPTLGFTKGVSAFGFTPDGGGSPATTDVTLPNGYFVIGQTYSVEVQWTGNTFVCRINGATFISGTDTSFTANNKLGFLISSSTINKIDNFKIITGVPRVGTPSGQRQTDILSVSNGNIYIGNIASQAVLVGGGTAAFSTNTRPQAGVIFGKAYIVDGYNTIKKVNLLQRITETYTTSGGTETTTTLGRYTLATVWRGRLVLAADRFNPQNFIMSKVGDPLNWDYTATTPDAAFAGNASTAGRIGDPITALMPASDDTLYIGGDHNLWVVRGDPADGGSIDLVSDSIGVYGATAWTKSPDGTLYFIGTTGLFRIVPGGQPELLSGKQYNQYFAGINRLTKYVTVTWDRDRHGLFMFVTPTSSGTATHLFYDQREGGFWEISYPDSHGPITATVYDGDSPTDRVLLMGGRTGFVQIQSDTNRRDDGTAISCNVVLGPFQPAPPTGDSLITGLDITFGEVFTGDSASVWNANWTIKAGKSAYDVTDGTAIRTAAGNMGSAGRQTSRVVRIRGGWFTVSFSNSNDGDYFSLERVVVRVQESGRQR
jgi:hypothetical protein